MLSVTVEQFRMIYCDASEQPAAPRREAIVPCMHRQRRQMRRRPTQSVRSWQLSDDPLFILVHTSFSFAVSCTRHADAAEHAYRCRLELPSLIRNTLRRLQHNLSVMTPASSLISISARESLSAVIKTLQEQRVNLINDRLVVSIAAIWLRPAITKSIGFCRNSAHCKHYTRSIGCCL